MDETRNITGATTVTGRSAAILRRRALTGKSVVLLSPPNIGQELFDVVDITDPSLALSAQAWHVASIALTFAPGRLPPAAVAGAGLKMIFISNPHLLHTLQKGVPIALPCELAY
jgi:hypothetical protein